MKTPYMLVPETAHFAFDKAALISGAILIKVPVDPKTKKLNLVEMRKYINWYGSKNIAAIGASAPNWPYGTMDDIPSTGMIAHENGVPLHVDACLGGFVHMFHDDILADFRCQGVVSISLDSHKYGLTGKGSSIVVFKKSYGITPTMDYLNHEAGCYVTQGLSGSTRGEVALEVYAMLTTLGKD